MTQTELVTHLQSTGWTVDSYGHYHKGERRMKLQQNSVRYERSYRTTATAWSKSKLEWIRIKSGYYKDLSVVDGLLAGLTR